MNHLPPDTSRAPWRDQRAKRYSIAIAVVFVAIFGAAITIVGDRVDLAAVAEDHWPVLAGLAGLSMVNYTTRAIRWHFFCAGAGVSVPLMRNSLYFVAGFSMTVTPGKIGEMVRLWLLRTHHGYSYTQTAPAMLADRLSDLSSIVLLSLATVGTVTGFLPVVLSLFVALLAGISLILRPKPALLLLSPVLRRIHLGERPLELLRHMFRTMSNPSFQRIFIATMPLVILGWLAEAAGFYWILLTLGADVSFAEIVFIFSFAMLVGVLVFLPGGLGGTEATMGALLVALGVDLQIAVLATGIIRITTLWFAVALGFIALVPALRTPRSRGRMGTS